MEGVPLDGASGRESDSPRAAVPSKGPRVEEMEEEAKEGKPTPPPPAAIGTVNSEAVLPLFFFFLHCHLFAHVCSSVFYPLFFQTVTSLLGRENKWEQACPL